MAWTEITRCHYDRRSLRYASDCTDVEWSVIAPFFEVRKSKVGRPIEHDPRTLWDAMQYIAATGCQRSHLPKDFPPFTTVQHHFYRMRDNGLLDLINEVLVALVRLIESRDERPTVGIIDSQSAKTTEAVGPRGYDAGKKIKGRKRHVVTDTAGNMLSVVVHEASIQDRDGAPGTIASAMQAFPTLTKLFADSAYAGEKLTEALATIGGPILEIVRRPEGAAGFVVIAKRWVVERTFAWLNR